MQVGQNDEQDHDARTFLISEVHPETGTTRYTYDNVGNRLSKTMETAGTTETFTYDDRNRRHRIMKIELPGAPATAALKTIAAQYAFADDFPLVDAALFVYIAMGDELVVLFAVLTRGALLKKLKVEGLFAGYLVNNSPA